ncbi:hypothetical protein CC80DRAFT_321217 [Byssothecium circinans]|uniref:Uncharacterized protein n=1 Tax=Byssothecium circinans TaxID=147558 RepID=A0A6A5U5B6_9PLEO|nr:hypothetical protein CC80DRAFT_321217 [Byssothecium circinans]
MVTLCSSVAGDDIETFQSHNRCHYGPSSVVGINKSCAVVKAEALSAASTHLSKYSPNMQLLVVPAFSRTACASQPILGQKYCHALRPDRSTTDLIPDFAPRLRRRLIDRYISVAPMHVASGCAKSTQRCSVRQSRRIDGISPRPAYTCIAPLPATLIHNCDQPLLFHCLGRNACLGSVLLLSGSFGHGRCGDLRWLVGSMGWEGFVCW